MGRSAAIAVASVALVVALGCARRHERRAAGDYVYAAPEVPSPAGTPSARGGGPPATTPDAALTPRYELDANAALAQQPELPTKGDSQADGPSGGTYGSSTDDRSPGAAYGSQQRAGVEQSNTVSGP